VEFSIRAKAHGFKLGHKPTMTIMHREHATLINGQKDFNYQDVLAQSHAKFKDKMTSGTKSEEEKLPPLDRKLKILYLGMYHDYGEPSRGISFEHDNFYPSLRDWHGIGELIHFDFVALAREHGVPKMSNMLMDAVHKNQPDAMFSIFFNPEHDPRMEVVRKITETTPCATMNWFCDSHWRYDDFDSRWAPNLSFCITTSTDAHERYKRDGFENRVIKSQWGASPKYRRIEGVKRDIDVSFVGQPHGNRRAMIEAIRHAGINVQAYGTGWGQRLSFEEMVMTFNRSKINLNLSNASGMRGKQIKGRNFEVPACGGFLLTEIVENLGDYYRPGREVESYDTVDKMLTQIKYYLANEERREHIAQAGYDRTMRDHTYSARYDHIFSRAGLL
jgi:spore maturation protein CgeB